MIEDHISEESIFKVGKVISVNGRVVKIKVNKAKNTSHINYKGKLIKNISVGGYIKITKGFIRIVGKVDGEFIEEEKIYLDNEYKSKKDKIHRILVVSLLGYFENNVFYKGIKELPLIDNECFLLEKSEFENIHDFVEDKDEPIDIGSLSFEHEQPVRIGINKMFASHIGIFGNTGSGKSYTLAKIYRQLMKIFSERINFKKYARFMIFDFNGEYSDTGTKIPITESKNIFNLSTKGEGKDKLPINETDLIDIQLLSILGSASEKTQQPFLKRTIAFYKNVNDSDDPQEYFRNILRNRIKDILKMSDKVRTNLLIDYVKSILPTEYDEDGYERDLIETIDWNNTNNHWMPRGGDCRALSDEEIHSVPLYENVENYILKEDLISNFIDFLYLQLIHDVLNSRAQNEHIAPVINKLKSAQKDIKKIFSTSKERSSFWEEYNFTVINLNDVNLYMKKTVPLLVAKNVYDEQKELRKKSDKYYLNIIVDEAHNILSGQSFRESETWKDYRLETFEEIIKEGRKFGVFLTVASQRPADISPTIISQLHNYIIHRLINNSDLNAIEKTVSYLDKVSFEYIPILPTGTCIMAGLFANIPLVVDIGSISKKYCPNNDTIELVKHWK